MAKSKEIQPAPETIWIAQKPDGAMSPLYHKSDPGEQFDGEHKRKIRFVRYVVADGDATA